MSEEEKHQQESSDASIYYVLGGVVLVAAVAGFFLLKPKEPTAVTPPPAPVVSAPAVTPTPMPITKFACEKQYYNPVIGFPKYFLSAEGVDTATTGEVTCTFTASVKDKVVATKTTTGQVTADPTRGGGVFRCQSDAVELAKGVTTKVAVKMENATKAVANCEQNFVFP